MIKWKYLYVYIYSLYVHYDYVYCTTTFLCEQNNAPKRDPNMVDLF